MEFVRRKEENNIEITCFGSIYGLEKISIDPPVSLGDSSDIVTSFEHGVFPFPTSENLGCFRFDMEILFEHNFGRDPFQSYYKNGKLHRDDGPAEDYGDGNGAYYIDGKLHRKNGPAIKAGNVEMYYNNGRLDRMGGPAVLQDGFQANYKNG